MRIFAPAFLAVPWSAVYRYVPGCYPDKRFVAVYDAHALSENLFPEGSVRTFSRAGRRGEKVCLSVYSHSTAVKEDYSSVRNFVT